MLSHVARHHCVVESASGRAAAVTENSVDSIGSRPDRLSGDFIGKGATEVVIWSIWTALVVEVNEA